LKYASIIYPVNVSSNNALILMATIYFDSSKIGRYPNKIKPILQGKKRRLEPVISCHDIITLKSLRFLIYENDIATFGSAKAQADIADI